LRHCIGLSDAKRNAVIRENVFALEKLFELRAPIGGKYDARRRGGG
jgi:hypothetical protein